MAPYSRAAASDPALVASNATVQHAQKRFPDRHIANRRIFIDNALYLADEAYRG